MKERLSYETLLPYPTANFINNAKNKQCIDIKLNFMFVLYEISMIYETGSEKNQFQKFTFNM